jgi:hypothetical protein
VCWPVERKRVSRIMMEEVEQKSVRRRLEAIGSVSNSDFATTRRDLAEQGSG